MKFTMNVRIEVTQENLLEVLNKKFIASLKEKVKGLGLPLEFISLNLQWANLSKANLSKADLSKADLSKADLSKADLSEADLSEANLSKADLSEANLSKADLSEANLSKADLSKADLSEADLSKADLSEADLSEADLSEANLMKIKEDLFQVLSENKLEVPALLQALHDGKINGSAYEGDCACLIGTISNIKGVSYKTLKPDAKRPSERFFLAIRKGHTPNDNPVSKIVCDWITEFLYNNK